MSGEFHGEPERIMVSLDAVGNTTKAVTKGFAIGSAVIAAVALFASFIETAGSELGVAAENLKDGVIRLPQLAINVAEPKIFIGLLIGGAVPFLFSSLAIRAVGRTAGVGGAGGPQPVRRRQDHDAARRSPTTARSSTSAPRRRCAS